MSRSQLVWILLDNHEVFKCNCALILFICLKIQQNQNNQPIKHGLINLCFRWTIQSTTVDASKLQNSNANPSSDFQGANLWQTLEPSAVALLLLKAGKIEVEISTWVEVGVLPWVLGPAACLSGQLGTSAATAAWAGQCFTRPFHLLSHPPCKHLVAEGRAWATGAELLPKTLPLFYPPCPPLGKQGTWKRETC